MTIIFSKRGGKPERLEKTDFLAETNLQQYIADNPEAIPINEIKEGKELLILGREFPTEIGRIDAVGIDSDGDIYVIETKLFKNPDKRLVLAQILDYGAALWNQYSGNEDFLSELRTRFADSDGMDLETAIISKFQIPDDEVSDILTHANECVASGTIKFVVLMDRLGDRLKTLIKYINTFSDFDIYAVELEYYKTNEVEIVKPDIFGAEVHKRPGKSASSPAKKWTEELFLQDLNDRFSKGKISEASHSAIAMLYELLKVHADRIDWGRGQYEGVAKPIKLAISESVSPFLPKSSGKILLHPGWIRYPIEGDDSSLTYHDRVKEKLSAHFPSSNLPSPRLDYYAIEADAIAGKEEVFLRCFEFLNE